MDIYLILASKPHNTHYLNRYITFIRSCKQKNIDQKIKLEKHHICPKGNDLFPEFRSFSKNPWNRVDLTPRQHFIAHLLLRKVYKNSKSCYTSLFLMCNNGNWKHYSSKFYESIKLDYSKEVSNRMRNKLVAIDKSGKIFHLDRDDPRYVSGEMKHLNKGKIVVRDIDNNCFSVYTNDPRYISGELVGVQKGRGGYKWNEESRNKLSRNNVGFSGKQHSEKSKLKTSASLIGKRKKLNEVVCPHCNKVGKGPNMARYHFSKCKFITSS